jgi:diguanylate cyclase (GGDEF)-like protein
MHDAEQPCSQPGQCDLLDYIPTGVFILSPDFTILFWNRCMEEWTKIPRREIVGSSLFDHFPRLQAPRYLNRISEIFRGGPPTVFSSQFHKHLIPAPLPGGGFRVQSTLATGVPTGKPGEFHAIFSIQDVTSLTEAINNYNMEHRKLLGAMAEQARAEEELTLLNKKLKEQSIRDGLTGLYNHRHFWQVIRRDFLLAERHGNDIACLLIDLDFFKKVNDAHGHLIGDAVLKNVARLIQKKVRKTDVVSRYGGEEFAVLLPSTDIAGAKVFAENIRRTIETHGFKTLAVPVRVTVSIGVATLREHLPTPPKSSSTCPTPRSTAPRPRGGTGSSSIPPMPSSPATDLPPTTP